MKSTTIFWGEEGLWGRGMGVRRSWGIVLVKGCERQMGFGAAGPGGGCGGK